MTQHPYLDEDEDAVVVCAPDSQELARFTGEDALDQALAWAEQAGLELRSNVNPADLLDFQRLYFRRRPRFLRLTRYNQPATPADPPNVKRIIVPNYEEGTEPPWDAPNPWDDDVVLAPDDSDDKDEFE